MTTVCGIYYIILFLRKKLCAVTKVIDLYILMKPLPVWLSFLSTTDQGQFHIVSTIKTEVSSFGYGVCSPTGLHCKQCGPAEEKVTCTNHIPYKHIISSSPEDLWRRASSVEAANSQALGGTEVAARWASGGPGEARHL